MTNLGAARSIERKQDFGDREPFPRGAERRDGPERQELCNDLRAICSFDIAVSCRHLVKILSAPLPRPGYAILTGNVPAARRRASYELHGSRGCLGHP